MDKIDIGVIMFVIGLVLGMLFGMWLMYDGAYKTGQVDALTGKIQYELVTQPDSTRIWEEIE